MNKKKETQIITEFSGDPNDQAVGREARQAFGFSLAWKLFTSTGVCSRAAQLPGGSWVDFVLLTLYNLPPKSQWNRRVGGEMGWREGMIRHAHLLFHFPDARNGRPVRSWQSNPHLSMHSRTQLLESSLQPSRVCISGQLESGFGDRSWTQAAQHSIKH